MTRYRSSEKKMMDEEDGDEWLQEAQVMSEMHIGSDVGLRSTVSVFLISASAVRHLFLDKDGPRCDQGRATSKDKQADSDELRADEHGDLVLLRRTKHSENEKASVDKIVVRHHLTTRLPEVGLQIWRGALMLADFILHTIITSSNFNHVIALELGAGTGLTALAMARVASLVFVTDRGADILDNCNRNVVLNSSFLRKGEATVRVRELDWQQPWPPDASDEENCLVSERAPYKWSAKDTEDAGKVSVLLAADVVYSTDLTSAFFNVLKKLMPPKSQKVLYLAMEKRYNFSLTDLDVVAHGYKHFRSLFDSYHLSGEESCDGLGPRQVESITKQNQFYGKLIDVSEVQQYITNYDRGKDLELWEIRSW